MRYFFYKNFHRPESKCNGVISIYLIFTLHGKDGSKKIFVPFVGCVGCVQSGTGIHSHRVFSLPTRSVCTSCGSSSLRRLPYVQRLSDIEGFE